MTKTDRLVVTPPFIKVMKKKKQKVND